TWRSHQCQPHNHPPLHGKPHQLADYEGHETTEQASEQCAGHISSCHHGSVLPRCLTPTAWTLATPQRFPDPGCVTSVSRGSRGMRVASGKSVTRRIPPNNHLRVHPRSFVWLETA